MSKQYRVVAGAWRVEMNNEWEFVQFTPEKYLENDMDAQNEWVFVKDLDNEKQEVERDD